MKLLTRLQSRIFDTPLAIRPEKLDAILQGIGPRLNLDWNAENVKDLNVMMADDWDTPSDRKSYKVTDEGIACIPIQGTLMKKAGGLWAMSGNSSYEKISRQVSEACSDSVVRGILLDIDSPGGETHGMFELGDLIYSLRGEKPIYAIANDGAMSAAYAIASAADKIFVTRTGALGSVGVFALHIDQSRADDKAGLAYTYIHAGAKKTDGTPHEPLSKSAKSDAQAEVDREYEMFVDLVARNRRVKPEAIRATEAGVYFADGAIPLLGDEVGTFEDALQAITQKVAPGTGSFSAKGAPLVPAIAPHSTATVKKAWDGPGNKRRLKENGTQAYYESAHAYRNADENPETKGAYTYIHHQVSGNGDVGAANIKGCTTGIGLLNGARGAGGHSSYSKQERQGIWNHLAKHIRDAGETPADLKSFEEYQQVLAAIAAEEGEANMAKTDDLAIAAATGASTQPQAGKADDMADDMSCASCGADMDADDKFCSSCGAEAPGEDDDKPKKTKKGKAKKAQALAAAKALVAASKSDDEDDDEDDSDDGNDDDDDDGEDDDKKDAKKGKKAMKAQFAMIANTCKLAGFPDLAAEFIAKDYSLAKVQALLLEKRSAVSEAKPVNSYFGSATAKALDKIELQVQSLMANDSNLTKPQAYDKLLKRNPQLYTEYLDERPSAFPNEGSKKQYLTELSSRFPGMGLGIGS